MKFIFYGDDTNLKLGECSAIDDTFFFGGVLISEKDSMKIERIFERTKKAYNAVGLPLKWNFRALEKVYREAGKQREFLELNAESCQWRREIFEQAVDVDFRIVLCGNISYSSDKKKIIQAKPKITRFVFTNAMQRVGMEAKDRKFEQVDVVLDWPTNDDHKIFSEEYRAAYNFGHSHDGKSKYYCGRLKNLKFGDAPLFAITRDKSMLQFTDMVVGATKDFIDTVLTKRVYSFGHECFPLLLPRFRGYPDKVLQCGLVLKPSGISNSTKLFLALEGMQFRTAA